MIKISIGVKPDISIVIMWELSYIRVGRVTLLKFFKWIAYQRVGGAYMILGITFNKKETK